jgi:hypothetical protein
MNFNFPKFSQILMKLMCNKGLDEVWLIFNKDFVKINQIVV